MSITLVDITELPAGTATLSNPIMFGIGELLHTTTLEDIKTLLLTGVITEIPPNKIKIVNIFPHATFDEEWEVNQLNAVGNAINYSLTTYYGDVITTVPGERIVFRLILSDPNVLTPNVLRYYYSEVSGDLTFTGITNALNDIVPNGFVRNEPEDLVELGNIEMQSIAAGFNTSDDAPFNMTSETFITAIQDGDSKIWKWIGDDGSFGGGSTQAVLGDFLLIEQAPLTPLNYLPVKKIEVTPYTITNDDLNRPLWFTSNNQVVNIPTTFLGTNTNILLYDFEAYFSGTGTHTVNHPQSGVDTFSQGDYIKALRYDNAGNTLWTVQQWSNETGAYAVSERNFQGVVPEDGLVNWASQTGALKIKLPIRANYTSSIRLQLEIRKIGNPYSLEVIDITARPSGATGWSATARNVNRITSSDGNNYSVRYGNDGTSPCIWIGELADSFSDSGAYFCLRYVAYSETTNTGLPMNFFKKGWVLSRATSFGTVVATQNTSEWRSARTFVSTLPSGQSAGRIRTNSADGNRPYHDNGTAWKGLAYTDEIPEASTTNYNTQFDNEIDF